MEISCTMHIIEFEVPQYYAGFRPLAWLIRVPRVGEIDSKSVSNIHVSIHFFVVDSYLMIFALNEFQEAEGLAQVLLTSGHNSPRSVVFPLAVSVYLRRHGLDGGFVFVAFGAVFRETAAVAFIGTIIVQRARVVLT